MRIGIEPLPASVRDLACGLHQEQARIRGRGEQTSAAALLDQRLIVEIGLESEQTEAKSVLAAGLAVAPTRVAAEFCEDRNDLVREIHR